jgi:hypothetical protein
VVFSAMSGVLDHSVNNSRLFVWETKENSFNVVDFLTHFVVSD